MKEWLRRILTILCVLVLGCGCIALAAAAEGTGEAKTAFVAVSLNWADEHNADGLRPESVSITLRGSDGNKTAELTAENGWTWIFEGLDKNGSYTCAATAPTGYSVPESACTVNSMNTLTAAHHVDRVAVSVAMDWQDQDNARGVRPSLVKVRLLADGKPYASGAALNIGNGWSKTWDKLPALKKGTLEKAAYTVEILDTPTYYTAPVVSGSQAAGYTITSALQLGKLTIRNVVSGAPSDANLDALSFEVSGPKDWQPVTIARSQMSNGSFTIEDLLPGAYLVQERGVDTLIPGYVLDYANTEVTEAVMIEGGDEKTIVLSNAYIAEKDQQFGEPGQVSQSTLDSLWFRIIGPDTKMPIDITYGQFVDGRYEVNDVEPGVYVVTEHDADTLIASYQLTSDSVTALRITVDASGTATASLDNRYIPVTPTPSPTPEPTPTAGEPTPSPTPEPEVTDIPVVKYWDDFDNRDGNRPGSVTVHLLANGAEVDQAVLTQAGDWTYTFTGLPTKENGADIAYTITEDRVLWYDSEIVDFFIINRYHPETTSVSVRKIWNDAGNAARLRPASIRCTLSNGQSVVLSDSNGWFDTIDNLPTYLNGAPAVYTWSEQEVLLYTQTGYEVVGNTTTITNSLFQRGEPPKDKKVGKTRGDSFFFIDDYDTPLGVEITINHVGDCFD